MKKTQVKKSSKKKEIIVENVSKEQETKWYIPPIPSRGLPKYNSDQDKHCPRGQMSLFNDKMRTNADLNAESGKHSSDWLKNTLKSKFVDVPLRLNPNFRAANFTGNENQQSGEIDIIQKIVIRENILHELHKLIEYQSEVGSCVSEVVEMVQALRFQTLDIVEDIVEWRSSKISPIPFLYRGINYLTKIANDLDFLDQYDEIIERFCFDTKCID